MVWFKVDDNLHSHPKAEAASLAALGLWAVAGSWASDHLTDGEIPKHMIRSLSRGADELAEELVSCGLWRRTKSGYRFHQWTQDSDGSKRNPTREEIEELRRKKAEAGRRGGLASKAKTSGGAKQNEASELSKIRAEAGRKGGLASGNTRSKPEARASTVLGDSLNPRPGPSLSSRERGEERAHAARGAALAPPPNPFQSPPHEDERFWAEHERETRERLEAQHAAMDEARRTARSGAARARAALNGGKP